MTTTWNGTSIPDPETWEDADFFIGSQRVMADGSRVADYITGDRVLVIRWTNITAAQMAAIRTRCESTASTDLVLPDGYTYTCEPIPDSYVDKTTPGASLCYDVDLSVMVTAVA